MLLICSCTDTYAGLLRMLFPGIPDIIYIEIHISVLVLSLLVYFLYGTVVRVELH